MTKVYLIIFLAFFLAPSANAQMGWGKYADITALKKSGYFGSTCATYFGLLVPEFTVQTVPV